MCDICKQPMEAVTHRIKIKRQWHLWHEIGWESVDLCDNCAQTIIYKIQCEREKNECN